MAMLTPQNPWAPPDSMLVPVAGADRFLALTHGLDRFAGRWLKLRDQAPELLASLRHVAIVESAGASTRIEGAQLSDEEVSAVLSGLSIDSFRSRDAQEVRGYHDLSELIFESHRNMPISENVLKSMHTTLLRYSDKDQWHNGEYKRSPNHVEMTQPDGKRVVVFQTAPPAETQWWMQRLIEEFNAARERGQWHPLVLIADFIVWFLAIHPFQDGNGRLSRALTTLLLLQADYEYVPFAALERVVEENKARYYTALRRTQVQMVRDAAQYGEWLEFFLGALRAQQLSLEARVSAALASAHLPAAQRHILDVIREQGAHTSTALALQLGMSERTARYHLAALVGTGRLVATRRTAGRLYTLPLDGRTTDASVHPLELRRPEASQEDAPPEDAALPPSEVDQPVLDSAFQRYAGGLANGRAFATVVIAATPSSTVPLDDLALDAFEALAGRLAPSAEPVRATPEVGWWRISEPPNSDLLSMWLHPGPVVEVLWGVDAPLSQPLMRVSLQVDPTVLVAYWRKVLDETGQTLAALNHPFCAVALGLQTLPSVGGEIRDIDTARLKDLRRTGQIEAPPPWQVQVGERPTAGLAAPGLLRTALDRLLRHYSYRRTDHAVETALELAPASWSPELVASSRIE